mmetsp:Transcript_93623/g.166587  ORF Transcript_93623/g.166587 Transcript_93623/m.166587 type:complete len:609 (-) Transcript_93623:145-1971(-)
MTSSHWEVVGGSDKGGILVREGSSLKSAECSTRLSTGAIVLELERAGDRLHYLLVKGTGPREGWISLKVAGKDLIQPTSLPEDRPAFLSQQLPEHVQNAVPEGRPFPSPVGRCFGKEGKMKMLYLHGGGVSKTIAQMQLNNTFKEVPMKKSLEWSIWTGPHSVPLGWNGDFSLKPFGPDFSVYFERLPYANCQWETWEGIEKSVQDFKAFLKENGPFDGAMGFDMGGEFLVHIANLATEGDTDLAQAFRFLILFTTTSPKHLSPMGKQRCKSPLHIPAVCSWSNSDENHPYLEYEELCLFIHKDFREVIVHADGHKPPSLKKDQSAFQRFVRFLEAMQQGSAFVPSDHEDNSLRANLWLPLSRLPARSLKAAAKRLLVVTDPMGPGGDLLKYIEQVKLLKSKGELVEIEGAPFRATSTPPRPIQRLEMLVDLCSSTSEMFEKAAGSDIKVQSLTYSEEQKHFNWHCKMEDVPSRQLLSKDIIDDEDYDDLVKAWAKELLASLTRDDDMALLGLGTGGYIAFALARMLLEDGHEPAGLWLVNPPLRLPWASCRMPGTLKACPVHLLVDRDSTYGPGWRYEVATCGPFSTATYEDLDDLVQKVIAGVRSS